MSLPARYIQMRRDLPAVVDAYEHLGAACAKAGPLDPKTIAIVKLAVSLGAGLEGAAHSHARMALEAGWTREDLLHVAVPCTPTIGFPPMMRGRGWVMDVVSDQNSRP